MYEFQAFMNPFGANSFFKKASARYGCIRARMRRGPLSLALILGVTFASLPVARAEVPYFMILRLASNLIGLSEDDCNALLSQGSASEASLAQITFDTLKRFQARLSLPEDKLLLSLAGSPFDPILQSLSPQGQVEAKFVLADKLKTQDLSKALVGTMFFSSVPTHQLLDASDWKVIAKMVQARDQKNWTEAIRVIEKEFSPALRQVAPMRSQLAFMLNRRNQEGDRDEATHILLQLLHDGETTGEVYGMLGRISKDRYEEARDQGQPRRVWLTHLIHAKNYYLHGFKVDPANFYPGVNAIELLLEIGSPASVEEATALLPILSFAIKSHCPNQRIEDTQDYWLLATALEHALISGDINQAERLTQVAVERAQAAWMLETTLMSLRRVAGLRALQDKAEQTKVIIDSFSQKIADFKSKARAARPQAPTPVIQFTNTHDQLDLRPVDIQTHAESSGLSAHMDALRKNSLGVITIQEFLTQNQYAKPLINGPYAPNSPLLLSSLTPMPEEGYLLGLTEKGHRPVYEAIANHSRLETWWKAYPRHGLNGDEAGHIEKFMGTITSEHEKRVVFLVPKNLFYSNIKLSHTAEEMAWILQDPEHRAPHVQFVFGAYDLYSPEFVEDLARRRGYETSVDLMRTILNGYRGFLKSMGTP